MWDRMSPLRYKVVVYRPGPQGDTTRDPEPAELPFVRAFVGAFVKKHGREPDGVRVVWFQTIHQ
jgi:hypothetical protein